MSRYSRRAIRDAAMALAIVDHYQATIRGRAGGEHVYMTGTKLQQLTDVQVLDPQIAQYNLEQAELLFETIKIRSSMHSEYRCRKDTVRQVERAIDKAREHLDSIARYLRTKEYNNEHIAQIQVAIHRYAKESVDSTTPRIAFLKQEISDLEQKTQIALNEVHRHATIATRHLTTARKLLAEDTEQFFADSVAEACRNVARAADLLMRATECGLAIQKGRAPTDEWLVAKHARAILDAARAMAAAEHRVDAARETLEETEESLNDRERAALRRMLGRIETEAHAAPFIFGRAATAAAAPSFAVSSSTRGSASFLARIFRRVMPTREGLEWWADLSSMLSESAPEERTKFINSYLRGAPRVVMESWTKRLFSRRTVAYEQKYDREGILLAKSDDPPGWRLAFSVLHGDRKAWLRIAGLAGLIVGGLVVTFVVTSSAVIPITASVISVIGGTIAVRNRRAKS